MKPEIALLVVVLLPGTSLGGIVKGPYLQDVQTDRVTVVCETDAGDTCSVEWGNGFSNSTGLSADGVHHEGVVSGLNPSTCYPYQVVCAGSTSPPGSLCAAPIAGEPFSFVLFGDTRSNHDDHRRVVEQIMAEGVDFYINTGDLVSSGENEEDWVHFFEVEDPLLINTPFYPVVGNHDNDGGNLDVYERLFALPTESSGRESYYAFTYGNVRFIAIDNKASLLWEWFLDLEQKNWLLAEVDSAQADPDIEHIFVLVHENMYSSKPGRSGDMVLRGMRNDLKAKGVSAIFSGHDHYYERGEADNGLLYVISGGGGAGLYDTANTTEGSPVDIMFPVHTIHYSKSLHHYLRIQIHGPYFHACAKDTSGTCYDEFSYGEQPVEDGGVVDAGYDGGLDAGSDAGPLDGWDAGYDAGPDAGVAPDGTGPLDGADGGSDPGQDEGGPCDCSSEAYEPVCGEDGVTYDNMCELDCAQMGMEHTGPCQEVPCEDQCPAIEQLVCGQDGTTYTNHCFLQCAGVAAEHEGACEDSLDCTACPTEDAPVCGRDGKTYRNDCVMTCMGVEPEHDGPCAEPAGSSCGCGADGKPGGWLVMILFVLLAGCGPLSRSRRR